MFLGAGKIVQAGFLVGDIDRALDLWVKRGAGPFFAFREVEVELLYRGRPSGLKVSLAIGQLGDYQIELVQQHCDRPSALRDSFPDPLAPDACILQHLGMNIADFDGSMAAVRDQGLAVAMEGTFMEWRFAYIDTRDLLGFMSEFNEITDGSTRYFANIAAAAKSWDGSDPVRAG